LATISFFAEDVSFHLKQKKILKNWLREICLLHQYKAGNIHFIFCSDTYLLALNKQYLKHNTYTDIITFDYTEDKLISGDIFISIHRVKENATQLNISFDDELYRVMAHGVLHLIGFKDKNPKAKMLMTAAEDKALGILAQFLK